MSQIVLDTIMDPDLSQEEKIQYFSDYIKSKLEDEILDLLSRVISMYKYTGLKSFQSFLFDLTKSNLIPPLIRVEAAHGLTYFRETLETIEKWDTEDIAEEKKKMNLDIEARNLEHYNQGLDAINNACIILDKLNFAYRTQTIIILLTSDRYQDECMNYFLDAINDTTVECKLRYNFLLSIEKLKDKKDFVRKGLLAFLYESQTPILYKILSAQYLLTHFYNATEENPLKQDISINIQHQILQLMNDTTVEYNLRADAADLLLNLGSKDIQELARDTIYQLGGVADKETTIFNNAQNVHTKEIENSVSRILNYLSTYNDNKEYDFDQLQTDLFKAGYELGIFTYDDDNSKNDKLNKIRDSFDRIKFDRKYYTSSQATLQEILKQLWTYIQKSEFTDELLSRLFEELYDMSGTCSSGFASRLANVISGYDGTLAVQISYEDQLVSNFIGRMNYRTRLICEPTSPFRKAKLNDVIALYLKAHPDIFERLSNDKLSMKEYIDLFLKDDTENKIEECITEFQSNVLNEMTIVTYKAEDKPNFLLFVITYLSEVANELKAEFGMYIPDDQFENGMRKALSTYEGVKM